MILSPDGDGLSAPAVVAFWVTACGAAPIGPAVVVVPPPRDPAALEAPPFGADAGAPKPAGAVAAIAWMTSEPEARARARKQRVPMIVFASAAWAVATVQMDRTVWSDPRVAALAARFVALRLELTDPEGDSEGYAQRYGVTSVPELVVLDDEGRTLDRVGGLASVDRVLAALRKADE